MRVDEVQAEPAQLRSGGTVNLNATYTILSPSDQPMTVRETREVRLNGELVANPAVDVVRQTGTYSSALPITLPPNARTGRYEVTVTGPQAIDSRPPRRASRRSRRRSRPRLIAILRQRPL